MRKNYYRFVAVLLVVVLFAAQMLPAISAAEAEQHPINTFPIVSSENIIEECCITERVTININGKTIISTRKSFSNNMSIIEITEDNITTVEYVPIDFIALKQVLSSNTKIQRSNSGLDERYVTTFVSTEITSSESELYEVVSVLSFVLSHYAMTVPYSQVLVIAAAVTSLAELYLGSTLSSIDMRVTITRDFYEVYDATDVFLGYYNVYYTIETETKDDDGNWQLASTEEGQYGSLYIG